MVDEPRRRVGWRTLAVILIGNLIPVAGVVWLGWDAGQILVLYWVENLIVGALTLPRILSARDQGAAGDFTVNGRPYTPKSPAAARGCLGLFFTAHYGLFCLVHGVFTFLIASGAFGGETGEGFGGVWERTIGSGDFRLAVLAVLAVQIVLLFREWILPRRWRGAKAGEEMMRPYGRIIALHLAVLFGGWLLIDTGAPTGAVLILCVVKAAVEILTEMKGGILLKPIKPEAGETPAD